MSNQPNKLNQRTSRPQTIAGVMGGVLKIFGIRASDSDLVARWAEIMGSEIANKANIIAIKKTENNKFNVVIRPTNPALALQLSYMSEEIKNKINKYFGRDAIEKISIRK